MPDDLRLTDPPTRLDKALEEMKEMYRETSTKTDVLQQDFTRLSASSASQKDLADNRKEILRLAQDRNEETRNQVTELVSERLESMEQTLSSKVDLKSANLDQIISNFNNDLGKQIKEIMDAQEAFMRRVESRLDDFEERIDARDAILPEAIDTELKSVWKRIKSMLWRWVKRLFGVIVVLYVLGQLMTGEMTLGGLFEAAFGAVF